MSVGFTGRLRNSDTDHARSGVAGERDGAPTPSDERAYYSVGSPRL
jgi:hypothetical protein